MLDVVCAGHVCLDLTPQFPERGLKPKDLFVGGKQSDVGAMVFSTGGSASNTGVALNRLGIFTPIMGRVGDDMIGKIISNVLRELGGTGQYLNVAKGEDSSYTVVLAVPGEDRIFLHNPAANDSFSSDDIDFEIVSQAKLFHFGYPALMRNMYIEGGDELLYILKRAKEIGVTTSVDMAQPDKTSEAAQQDWNVIFGKTLPYTDIFVPSIEEMLLLMDLPYYEKLKAKDDDILENLEFEKVTGLADKLLGMGAKIVVLKCGTRGYYVKTAGEHELARMGRARPDNYKEWANKEIYSGIYEVENVKSATGAGDCSIAGFLAGIINSHTPEMSTCIACAAGADSVTEFSAAGGIVALEKVVARIEDGWKKKPAGFDTGFGYDEACQLYVK